MQTSLSRIKQSGFSVTLDGDNLKITPSSKLTTTQREFLKAHKAEIISELKAEALLIPKSLITCGECLGFKCNNEHGQGSGHCLIGGGYGLWSETLHKCNKFNACVELVDLAEPKPDAIMITCYSPAGGVFEVEARDTQHAEWLKRMNPRRECIDGLKPVTGVNGR
jgi:hypothetical protein